MAFEQWEQWVSVVRTSQPSNNTWCLWLQLQCLGSMNNMERKHCFYSAERTQICRLNEGSWNCRQRITELFKEN